MQITYENYCTLKIQVFKINICSNLQIWQDYDYSFDKEGPYKSDIFGYTSEDI